MQNNTTNDDNRSIVSHDVGIDIEIEDDYR